MKTTVIEESFRKDGTLRHRLTTVTEEPQRTLWDNFVSTRESRVPVRPVTTDGTDFGEIKTGWWDYEGSYHSVTGEVYPHLDVEADRPLATVTPIRRDQ